MMGGRFAPAASGVRVARSHMSQQPIDALFFSYFEEFDRWHNDRDAPPAPGTSTSTVSATHGTTELDRARLQSVTIDGKQYDLARFLSHIATGDTTDYRRYDSACLTRLSGTFFESLASRHGHEIRHVNHVARPDLPALAARWSPRCIFLSSTFFMTVAAMMNAVRHVRSAWPDVPIVIGGLYLIELAKSLSPGQFRAVLSMCGADAYVQSPRAEDPVLRILRRGATPLEDLHLPATWVRRNGKYVWCDTPEPDFPIDDNWIRWDELSQEGLYHTVNMRTARSCAFSCSFCTFPVTQGPLTLGEPRMLEYELERLKRTGVRSLIFIDDTFNVPMPRFRELVDILARHDFEWYSYFRCQYADDDIVKRMVDAGCRSVFLGYESLDDQVLKNMNKAVNLKAFERGTEILKRNGLTCHANFIIGFPGDRAENTHRFIQFIDDHGIEFYNAAVWFSSPSTPIAARSAEFGVEGTRYDWKHDTMSSQEAFELEAWVVGRAKESAWVSEISAMSFWSEIVLYSNGLTNDEAKQTLRTYNDLAGRDLTRPAVDTAPGVARLRRLLDEKPFAPVDGVARVESAPALTVGRRGGDS